MALFWGNPAEDWTYFLFTVKSWKKNRQMENYEMWLILFLNGTVLSLLTSFLCASSYCVHSVLLSWVFPQALFVISSEMFIAETCLPSCVTVYILFVWFMFIPGKSLPGCLKCKHCFRSKSSIIMPLVIHKIWFLSLSLFSLEHFRWTDVYFCDWHSYCSVWILCPEGTGLWVLFFWDLMIHHLYCGLHQKVGRSGDGVELHSLPGFRVSVLMMDESSQQIASVSLRSWKKQNKTKNLLQIFTPVL